MNQLKPLITRANLKQFFPRMDQTIKRGFILKYNHVGTTNTSMSFHTDQVGEKGHVISVIYTLCECLNDSGAVRIADEDDGEVRAYDHIEHMASTFNHAAKDNSLYAFPGSYVQHGVVKNKQQGARYAFVIFFDSKYNTADIRDMWTRLTGQADIQCRCEWCGHCMKHNKSLSNHKKRCKDKPKPPEAL